MRQLIQLFILVLAATVAACGSPEEDSEAQPSPSPTSSLLALDSGTYVAVSTALDNGCEAEPRSFKDGFEAEVDVTGSNVDIADVRFVRDGNELIGPEERTIHNYQLTRGKDCIVTERLIWSATITADNAFDMWLTWDFAAQGSECTPEVAGLTVPCVSIASATFEPL